MKKHVVPIALAAVVLGGTMTACSSPSTTTDAAAGQSAGAPDAAPPAAGLPAARIGREQARTVIDVRTPEEFAAGHVEGAVNLNLQDPEFDARIAQLDRTRGYLVYCRSGNRSATAATKMRSIGLDVYDGGGLEDMADAGWTQTL